MHMENSLPAKMPTETSADNVSQLKSNRISIFEQKNRIIEIRNSANLPLQILLFINVYLAPIWMISLLQFFYVYAQNETAKHNQIVLGAVLFVIACPLEMFRLYLGYSGNLRENIADFAGFLILSAFIQQPIEVYYFYIVHKTNVNWFQCGVQLSTTILIFIQIIIGYMAMRHVTRMKAQQYHILALIEQNNKME